MERVASARAAAAVVAVAALAAAGCGSSDKSSTSTTSTVDSATVESGIKQKLSSPGADVSSVKCPSDVKSEAGATVTFTFSSETGEVDPSSVKTE